MGNHISCMSPPASNCKKNLIKIFHCTETSALSELEGPLTAAEVMMDFPAQFLCCVSSAVSRICSVPADEELRASEVYVLLPMHKLNTRFSADDMAFLQDALASQDLSQSKVAPLPASLSSVDQSSNSEGFRANLLIGSQSFKQSSALFRTNLQELPPYLMGAHNNMMSRSKSWMPKLETITEAHATV